MSPTVRDIAKMIDHALLTPSLTDSALEAGCRLALAHDVASVCIMPCWLRRAADLLAGSTVEPGTTIGFPHGGQSTRVKLGEAEQALVDGGRELDMVVNISATLSGNWNYVEDEIRQLTALTHDGGAALKVIFENCYLADDHKIRLARICSAVGADWIKTSTGFGTHGATEADVKLMRAHADETVQVKAAGGVHDLDALLRFRDLGVTRVGASRTADILEDAKHRFGDG